jgi:hypothetical protein
MIFLEHDACHLIEKRHLFINCYVTILCDEDSTVNKSAIAQHL